MILICTNLHTYLHNNIKNTELFRQFRLKQWSTLWLCDITSLSSGRIQCTVSSYIHTYILTYLCLHMCTPMSVSHLVTWKFFIFCKHLMMVFCFAQCSLISGVCPAFVSSFKNNKSNAYRHDSEQFTCLHTSTSLIHVKIC